jgi:hypothetical protein
MASHVKNDPEEGIDEGPLNPVDNRDP